MKAKTQLFASTAIASLIFSLSVAAQTSPASTPAGATEKQVNRPIPFHGMVLAVDQKNKTFTIHGKEAARAFKVTDKTVITKGAGNAKFTDILNNQEVSGAYWKQPDGTLEAKMVRIGPMSSSAKGKKAAASPSVSPRASLSPTTSPKISPASQPKQ